MTSETHYEVTPQSTPFGAVKILLVEDLMKLLEKCKPQDQVLIGTHAVGGEWCNIESVELPNDEEGYLGLTLVASDTYDARQF